MSTAPAAWAVRPSSGGTLAGTWEADELSRASLLPAGALLDEPGAEGVLVSAGAVLILERALGGRPLTQASIMAAVGSVTGAIEVSAPDGTVRALICGPTEASAAGVDLGLVGLLLEVGSTLVATSCGAAAAGHPAAAAADGLNRSGTGELGPGSLIFAGRWTEPFVLAPGSHATASFGHLGSVSVRRAP